MKPLTHESERRLGPSPPPRQEQSGCNCNLRGTADERPGAPGVSAGNGSLFKVTVDTPNAPKPRGTVWSVGERRWFDHEMMAGLARVSESDVD
jgi:hypothetical protein